MAAAGDIPTRGGDRTLSLTNLDKVLYPSVGFTKAEVIDYYLRIAPVMLPHIRDRVMTRLRFPDGVGADKFSFYEKNAPMGTPDWVRRVNVGTSDGIIDYIVADDEAAIVWLANLAALEMHVPQWTVGSATPVKDVINLPELKPRRGEPLAHRVVVDLDPGARMTTVESARAALIVAALEAHRSELYSKFPLDGSKPCLPSGEAESAPAPKPATRKSRAGHRG